VTDHLTSVFLNEHFEAHRHYNDTVRAGEIRVTGAWLLLSYLIIQCTQYM